MVHRQINSTHGCRSHIFSEGSHPTTRTQGSYSANIVPQLRTEYRRGTSRLFANHLLIVMKVPTPNPITHNAVLNSCVKLYRDCPWLGKTSNEQRRAATTATSVDTHCLSCCCSVEKRQTYEELIANVLSRTNKKGVANLPKSCCFEFRAHDWMAFNGS